MGIYKLFMYLFITYFIYFIYDFFLLQQNLGAELPYPIQEQDVSWLTVITLWQWDDIIQANNHHLYIVVLFWFFNL